MHISEIGGPDCVVSMSRDEKKGKDEIKKNLDEIVTKLDQSTESSGAWQESVESNPEEWNRLKRQISEKQRALKELVMEKKSGRVGADEFEAKYKKLQDELSELEFAVYNMKLGTDIK